MTTRNGDFTSDLAIVFRNPGTTVTQALVVLSANRMPQVFTDPGEFEYLEDWWTNQHPGWPVFTINQEYLGTEDVVEMALSLTPSRRDLVSELAKGR
jgi:hypothetical protein